ncbi:GntR family transcriptional regulator [Rhodovibrionaceae bacterium A322]
MTTLDAPELSKTTSTQETPGSNRQSSRAPLHGKVVTELRQLIIEGDLAPGDRLPEKMLCERFNISRTPLREAIRVLASEGLVVLTPNRGARISTVTAEDVDEMFPIMGSLEALAGELACQHISEDQLAEIRAFHFQMVLHYRRRELSDYFRLNQAIHNKILEAANNPTLAGLHANLEVRICRVRYMANMSESRWANAVKEHEEMLEALDDRDGPRLAEILKRHLENKRASVKDALLVKG